MSFEPQIITPSGATNAFSTIDQPYPVTFATKNAPIGIWRGITDPTVADQLTEQGLVPDIPILTSNQISGNPGSDKNVVCRWITPSFQTVGGSGNPEYIDVGVMAFHYSGIDRIEFFLNGPNNKTTVLEATYNPEKDITAYWIRINADQLNDAGELYHKGFDTTAAVIGRANTPTYIRHHELQAVVYPKDGRPRILHGKPNNNPLLDNNQILYNAIPRYRDQNGIIRSCTDNGIRSFYFSSNKNNTLFNGSVYVDAANGIDNLSRSGDETEPMQTIEFAFRKLMQMKFKHWNGPNSSFASIITDGDVGGGRIYLMDLGDGPAKFLGHKMGYKDLSDQTPPSTVKYKTDGSYDAGFPFKCLAHRWVTISPAPGVSDKKRAKIKGFHPQKKIDFYKQASYMGIICPLVKYENLYIESDYPYTEYLYGNGPVLDQNETTSKLQFTDLWNVKKGVASKQTTTGEKSSDQLCAMWAMREDSMGSYTHLSTSAAFTAIKNSVKFIMPPRTWFDATEVDGGSRTPQRIYEWANATGLTYTTTMITPFNHNTLTAQQLSAETNGAIWTNDIIGIQHKTTGQLADGGTYNNANYGCPPLQLDKVPSIFVKSLTPMTGFCGDAGYTFNFSWVNPIGSHTLSQFDTKSITNVFVTDTVIRKSLEPGGCRFDMFINSTIDQTQGDLFLGSGVIYQPFIINGYVMENIVNHGSASFPRIHSDILQSNAGEFSFVAREIGMNNVIFYRLNNPSPRSPRYDDIEKRHGITGTGRITRPNRDSQGFFSGQVKSGKFYYDTAIGGDGKTYEYTATPYNRDMVFCDCLCKTTDATQQWIVSCKHENILMYNTQFMSSNQATPIPNNQMTGRTHVADGAVRRYQDAVPSHPTLNSGSSGTSTTIHTSLDFLVMDNVQVYKVDPTLWQNNQYYNTPREKLQIFVSRNKSKDRDGNAVVTKVGIDFRNDSNGTPMPPEDTTVPISNLDYPFEVDGKVGDNEAKIFFPLFNLDIPAYLKEPIVDGSRPQPTASTRGIWWQNTLPSNTGGAPYGWYPSVIPYENFRNGSNGTAESNAVGIYWQAEKLGTGGDPTLGTGKTNPQPTDPGYNPNQRGFRNVVLYAYTNFDYDGTRTPEGRIRSRSEFVGTGSGGSGGSGGGGGGSVINVESGQIGDPPPSIQNHPITIRLSTTDITENMSWTRKDNLDINSGTTHGPDGIYPSSDLIQIPNYLERITEVADPNGSPEIGRSVSSEIIGNTSGFGNQGGVYVTGGVLDDIILNTNANMQNAFDIKNIATTFHAKARKNNGLTMSLILHGKSIPNSEYGEFNYIAAPPQQFDPDTGEPIWGDDDDIDTVHYEDFYKKFSYIAFNSKESPVTKSITSNQFSFRKSQHHNFVEFNRLEMDGLSLSSALNGTSVIDMKTQIIPSKLTKIQTSAIGCTCSFNSRGTELTTATKVSGTSNASTITCKAVDLEYLGFDGNQLRFKNKSASSMFSNTRVTPNYQHNGPIGSNIQDFQFTNSTTDNDYRFEPSLSTPDGDPPAPEESMKLRFLNPVGSGSKNLLAYKVSGNNPTRLFGGSNNIGITAGSYIRISGSPNNNGIYQVLSTIDGIDGDVLSNTDATGGLPEYQYLELSRSITAQEQAVGNNITIENVSHLPILHIKYRQQL